MFSSTDQLSCRCSLHAQLAARRHECYRQLAQAILGPAAPRDDIALVRALADHAALLGTVKKVTPLRPRRRAA
jgi:hypothetical protein